MKKIIILAVILIMTVAIVGCSPKKKVKLDGNLSDQAGYQARVSQQGQGGQSFDITEENADSMQDSVEAGK